MTSRYFFAFAIISLATLFLTATIPAAQAQDLDLGDAPESYGTFSAGPAGGGARHVAIGPYLGAARDVEADGQPSPGADGDDFDAGGDDEDGVFFLGPFIPGQVTYVQVIVGGGSARLHGYFDWDRDGDFDHLTNEHAIDNQLLGPGVHVLLVTVPVSASLGPSYARFRLSTFDGPGAPARGDWPDGEVEDYSLTIDNLVPTEGASWGAIKSLYN
jgi:hypothetical protein